MNKNTLIAAGLVILAGLSLWLIGSSVGDTLAGALGKTLWYLPYAALVGAVHSFRLA